MIYNSSDLIPKINYTEGIFIDYRYFDKRNITHLYEFGYGLSHTTFEYLKLSVTKGNASEYVPTTGVSAATWESGGVIGPASDYLFPANFTRISWCFYPWLNTTTMDGLPRNITNLSFLPTGTSNSSSQPLVPAGGAPGGNHSLYDIMYHVTADITKPGVWMVMRSCSCISRMADRWMR